MITYYVFLILCTSSPCTEKTAYWQRAFDGMSCIDAMSYVARSGLYEQGKTFMSCRLKARRWTGGELH